MTNEFEKDEKVESFLKKHNLEKMVEKVSDSESKLIDSEFEDLKGTKEAFDSSSSNRMEEAEKSLKIIVEEKLKKMNRTDLSVEVRHEMGTRYTGDDNAAMYVDLSNEEETHTLETSALWYSGMNDAPSNALNESSDSWVVWLMDEESPFYDESFVESYKEDWASIALEQFVHTLDESSFQTDLENLIKEKF